jgi:hypothetical protein
MLEGRAAEKLEAVATLLDDVFSQVNDNRT